MISPENSCARPKLLNFPYPLEKVLWISAIVLTIWSFGYSIVAGSDLWWHIASGRLILTLGRVPQIDSWSFSSEGHSWQNPAWLSDVLFAFLADRLGICSLAWWKWIILIVTYLLVFLLVYRQVRNWPAGYLCTLIAVAPAAPFLDVRPNLYEFLGFAILLAVAYGQRRFSAWLPILFLLWSNLHGTYFFGLVVLLILASGAVLHGDRAGRKRTFIIVASCIFLCLVSNTGLSIFEHISRYFLTSGSVFKSISEWQSPLLPGGAHSPLFFFSVVIYIIALSFWKKIPSLRPQPQSAFSALAISGLTLLMALYSRRFIPLFCISETLVLAPLIAHFARKLDRIVPSVFLSLLSLASGLLLIAPYPKSSYAFHYMTAEDCFPIDCCDFIEANNLSGNVFAFYNWGGYLHFRFGGRLKVFIDGRAQTAFDESTFEAYLKVLEPESRSCWLDIIESGGADYFLWPRQLRAQIQGLLGTGRWSILYEDSVSSLLVLTEKAPGLTVSQKDSPYRMLTRGVNALGQKSYGQAEELFSRALRGMPYLNSAYLYLARAQALQGKHEDARATLERCKKVYPQQIDQEILSIK